MSPLRQWLRLFLPVAIGVCVAVGAAAYVYHGGALQSVVEGEARRLDLADQDHARHVLDAALDLRVIAHAPALRRHVTQPDATARQTLAQLLQIFIEQKPLFDAVSVIGPGAPLRVQRSGAAVVVAPGEAVPAADLDRALAVTRDLPPRGIHVSRLNLLDEAYGRVQPYQPVMRLTLGEVVAGQRVAIEIRLRGAALLRPLQDLLAEPGTTSWLLDHEGYWLVHPDPRWLWGADLDPALRLDRRAPDLAAILDRAEGTARDSTGALLVYRRLQRLSTAAAEAGLTVAGPWLAVQQVPVDRLPGLLPTLPLVLAVGVLLAWAAACWGLVQLRLRALSAERQSRELEDAQRRNHDDQTWVRQHIYDLGLRINAAPDLRRFGEAFLAELAPSLGLAAACLYRVQDGRCVALASFGMARQDLPREFAPGQGLVGEVARNRQERRLEPVPAGYLDLAGGLGTAAAAELRIVPLWVHDTSFGVLELACTRRLDTRQEALLQQLTPVLALNLAGRGRLLAGAA